MIAELVDLVAIGAALAVVLVAAWSCFTRQARWGAAASILVAASIAFLIWRLWQ